MTENEILQKLAPADILALTAMGEQRGDSREGMSSVEERLACMMVVRNRLRLPGRFGDSYRSVCLQRKQFSCWNVGDPNRGLLMQHAYLLASGQPILDSLVEETRFLARGIESGVILDVTNGATHYYSPRSMVPSHSVPYWARDRKPCAQIGSSLYFKGV